MARTGRVRLVRTPLFLRHGEWRTTVDAYLPWYPRSDANCPAPEHEPKPDPEPELSAAGRVFGESPEYSPVPLSAQGEAALTVQIKAAFGMSLTDGATVVGVRQQHYAPLTPLCMLPRLPLACLKKELDVVLAPAQQQLEMAPLPMLEVDASRILDCAARLRGPRGDRADAAFAQLLCSAMGTRGVLRLVMAPAQLATVTRATAAFDGFCHQPGSKGRCKLNLCGEGSGKWVGYTRQPRREFFQVRKLGRLLGRAPVYNALARETWLGGEDAQQGEIQALRELRAQLVDSGGSETTLLHVDERVCSLLAGEVAALATADLRSWLHLGGADPVSDTDAVSTPLAARLSAGIRGCGNLSAAELDTLREALAVPETENPSALHDKCSAVLLGAAMAVVRSHLGTKPNGASEEVDVTAWLQRFQEAIVPAAPPDRADGPPRQRYRLQASASGRRVSLRRSPALEDCAPDGSTGLVDDGTVCEALEETAEWVRVAGSGLWLPKKFLRLVTDEETDANSPARRDGSRDGSRDGFSAAVDLYGSVEFETAAAEMFDMLHQTSVALLHVLGAGFGMDHLKVARSLCDTTTPSDIEFSASVLRMYRYLGGSRPEAACGVHADIGLLTLSPCADLPGLTVLDGTEHAWVDAEEGVAANICSVFAGECLGPWSNGKLVAPLHYVNEQSQAAAEQAAKAGGANRSGSEPVRHSWPFFFRSPGHAICTPPTAGSGSASEAPRGTAEFVESEVFGQRAWRRPKETGGERPEY